MRTVPLDLPRAPFCKSNCPSLHNFDNPPSTRSNLPLPRLRVLPALVRDTIRLTPSAEDAAAVLSTFRRAFVVPAVIPTLRPESVCIERLLGTSWLSDNSVGD